MKQWHFHHSVKSQLQYSDQTGSEIALVGPLQGTFPLTDTGQLSLSQFVTNVGGFS